MFVPTGRPVVRFVAALALLAAPFGALWWSGLVAPRVSISVSDGFDRRSDGGVAVVVVHNQGPLPARVGRLELVPRPDAGRYFEPPVRILERVPEGEIRIVGGDAARFTVRYAVDCTGVDRFRRSERGVVTPGLRVRLRVKGPLDVEHTGTAGEVALRGACGDPVDVREE